MKSVLLAISISMTVTQIAVAQSVTVMSWNIRYNNPDDGVNAWPHRKDWVAEIISENKVDIAGFQEVLVGQLEDLKQRLPEMDAYGVGRDDGQAAGEFSPIFYRRDRFEMLEKSTFWLSPTPEQIGSKGWDAALPRIASWLKLKDRQSGIVFFVVNTHFDHKGSQARTESAGLIVRKLRKEFSEHPVVLTGDFNTTPKTPPYQTLVHTDSAGEAVFVDTFQHSIFEPEGPNSTWNGFKEIAPDQRIDFIFTSSSIKVQHLRILTDQRDGRFPSDHLPVVSEIELQHAAKNR
jgi:endonuclease/exonuclease/phosphatase family metal-dependent hydrolase